MYFPRRTFSFTVLKSMGVGMSAKYPGAMASVTGSAKTPCLSFAWSFFTTSNIAPLLGAGSLNAGTAALGCCDCC